MNQLHPQIDSQHKGTEAIKLRHAGPNRKLPGLILKKIKWWQRLEEAIPSAVTKQRVGDENDFLTAPNFQLKLGAN